MVVHLISSKTTSRVVRYKWQLLKAVVLDLESGTAEQVSQQSC